MKNNDKKSNFQSLRKIYFDGTVYIKTNLTTSNSEKTKSKKTNIKDETPGEMTATYSTWSVIRGEENRVIITPDTTMERDGTKMNLNNKILTAKSIKLCSC